MALPTRKQQIDAVAKFLDSDRNEGRSLEEIAAEIVDGYLDAITPGQPGLVIREGMLLKTAIAGKVYRVAWIEDDNVWIVGETAGYGWLGSLSDDFWKFAEEYRPKKRIDGKMVEMTDEMIAEAWSNPDWQVGDRLSQRQRQFNFEIIATAPQSALLRQVGIPGEVGLVADSNSNLSKYYKREVKGLEGGW